MLGLAPGSVEAFIVDRDLAIRLAAEDERAQQQDEQMTSVADAPEYDESAMHDPFAAPPKEMGRLG